MNFNIKTIIGFFIMLISCYILLTIVGIFSPKIMWLRTIFIIIIMILNFTIYYLFIKPKKIIKFNLILLSIIIPITIILTFINHKFILNDFQVIHLIFLPSFVIMSIAISIVLFKLIYKDQI